MREIAIAHATEHRGLMEDRYFGEQEEARRSVTLIEQEVIEKTNFLSKKTRRNIVVKNFSLNSLVGKEFLVGNVKMRGVELCEPCKRPSKLSGKPGFKEAFYNCGGLRAEILTTGEIRKSDVTQDGEEMINRINAYQRNEMFHPLTCQIKSTHALLKPMEENGKVILICPTCNHKQTNWPSVVLWI
ncbi:MAG: hypothetical protein AAB522_03135 [Patescibacteria group bacterium]